jgi:hypothetical protein
VRPSTHGIKAMRMPNLGVSKEVQFQHRMDGSRVARRECRSNSDRVSRQLGEFERGIKGSFMARTSNVVNVEAVEITPFGGPSNSLRALRFKRLRRLEQAGQFRGTSGSGNVGA